MADEGNAFPVLANRIAKALGMSVSPGMNKDHEVMTVVPSILPEMAEMGACPGSMLLQIGSDSPVLSGVVVMLDGTASSESLLPFASGICRREVAPLQLMAPADMTYETGISGEQYLRVLVNTMKEQNLQIIGEMVDGDFFGECVRAARAQNALLTVCVTDAKGTRKALFSEERLEAIKDLMVLFHAPIRSN